jgi:hypothetical protein
LNDQTLDIVACTLTEVDNSGMFGGQGRLEKETVSDNAPAEIYDAPQSFDVEAGQVNGSTVEWVAKFSRVSNAYSTTPLKFTGKLSPDGKVLHGTWSIFNINQYGHSGDSVASYHGRFHFDYEDSKAL